MSSFLVYHRITEESGKAIAEELDIPHGESVRGRPTHLIRWGNGFGIGYTPRVVVNKKDAIGKCVNKELSTRIFRDSGVKVPEYLTRPRAVCVGRSVQHTQGQNFWLCWEDSQVATAREEGAEYFIKYIPIKQEWRVHVINGEVAYVQRKYARDRVSTSFMGIQGFRDDWHTVCLDPSLAGVEVCTQAINAVAALGLDFGGADVVVSIADNAPYVLEVNSGAATPTPVIRAPYVEYFKRRLAE